MKTIIQFLSSHWLIKSSRKRTWRYPDNTTSFLRVPELRLLHEEYSQCFFHSLSALLCFSAHNASWFWFSKLFRQCLLLFFLIVLFEKATGRFFCGVSRELWCILWLYISYLRGLQQRRPHLTWCYGEVGRGELFPTDTKKDCYKEWTAYLFFISTFKLFMQPFVVNDSHYCHIVW